MLHYLKGCWISQARHSTAITDYLANRRQNKRTLTLSTYINRFFYYHKTAITSELTAKFFISIVLGSILLRATLSQPQYVTPGLEIVATAVPSTPLPYVYLKTYNMDMSTKHYITVCQIILGNTGSDYSFHDNINKAQKNTLTWILW